MSRLCRRGCGPARGRVVGAAMMVVGGLLFLIFVPRWVWSSALGVALISAGFLLWRFGD